MPLDMTPEEKKVGQENFDRTADGLTRRDFMKSLAIKGGIVVPVTAAAFFGYKADGVDGKPVRTALIGAGDEGGVLAGEHNPKYLEIVAVCDFRPSNKERIFTGDLEKDGTPKKSSPRKGLNFHYGRNANQSIKVYDDIATLLADKSKLGLEAVIIALPLHLHAPVSIQCMNEGLHVLCEKLMAWNITQCKEMIRVAEKNDVALSIGHQRHYSMLYAHAQEVMKSGVLGDVRHIRALWHRNNARPKLDAKGQEIAGQYIDSWKKEVDKKDREALEKDIRKYGYRSMEELVHWRIYKRTGGGLMAELGSHQLDACSIFLGKVKPIAVSGVGGKFFYKDDREAEDHVFCTYEFPGPDYWADGQQFTKVNDPNSKVIVTYSSISTNDFEKYGECVMGSKGTMVVEQEGSIQLYSATAPRSTTVGVAPAGGGKPVLESSGSTAEYARAGGASGGGASGASGPVSRGYTQEMEHFAHCIRMWSQGSSKSDRQLPRCHGSVAMADAIIALTSNLAMKHGKRIEFKKEWFDYKSEEVPDGENKPETV